MKLMLRMLALFWGVSAFSQPAYAEWFEASSDHFVVYANDREKDVRRFATDLERYHAALTILTNARSIAPSPSARVTVFVVSNQKMVRTLYGKGAKASKYVGGFYIPRAGGSVAIVPRIKISNRELDFSMVTLLHEYAHHFMHINSRFPMPRWYSEGAAEFLASVKFEKDGALSTGMPAYHRGPELFHARDVKLIELLDPDEYERKRRTGYDAYYGKSWLLFHYLTNSKERRGQMQTYLNGMAAGKSSIDAALAAFGKISQLEKEVDRYLIQNRLPIMRIRAEALTVNEIRVRRLRPCEAAMMPVRIRSRRGVNEEQAAELKTKARAIAAQYPADPAVQAALAEAEFDAGNPNRAIAAADRAIRLDPGQTNAYVQKGYALFQLAKTSQSDLASAYRRARTPFIALNKLENDHPLPLIYYYRSFVEQGKTPPVLAVEGLEWASQLAPFDQRLALEVAYLQLRDGRIARARKTLMPLAYNPHGGKLADHARAIVERIDAGETQFGGMLHGEQPVEIEE